MLPWEIRDKDKSGLRLFQKEAKYPQINTNLGIHTLLAVPSKGTAGLVYRSINGSFPTEYIFEENRILTCFLKLGVLCE